MTNPLAKNTQWISSAAAVRSLKRLEFEMALDLGGGAGRRLGDVARTAAEAAGGELLFVLPARGTGESVAEGAVVRLDDEGRERYLQVRAEGSGFVVTQESEMDPALLGFARTSVALFAHLRAGRSRPGSAAA